MSATATPPEVIAESARAIAATNTPVVSLDTCNFLDLVRVDLPQREPRADAAEVRAAVELTALANERRVVLVVPELVPGELADHIADRESEFADWVRYLDQSSDWLAKVGGVVGVPHPQSAAWSPLLLAAKLQAVVGELLGASRVLAREPICVERALARLTANPKRRPSHKKEIKDSMNLEQVFELARLLRTAGFAPPMCWISSNVKDFAGAGRTGVHLDLAPEFAAVKLDYFVTLSAALGRLRANGHLPKS